MCPARVQASSAAFRQKVAVSHALPPPQPALSSERLPCARVSSIQPKGARNMSLGNRVLQATLIVLSLAFGIQAQDNQHCSNATMQGSYGFHATGKGFVAIGRFVFDGNGGLAGKLFIRVPGTDIGPLEFTGTYSVNPDCTVTDNWLDSTHVSVIVDQGKGYFIMNVSPSTAAEDSLNNGGGRRQ